MERVEEALSAPSGNMAPPPLPPHPLSWKLPEQEELDGGVSETTDDTASNSSWSCVSRSSQDTVSSSGKIRRRKSRKPKNSRPVGLSEILLDLLDADLRESTLRMLSKHLKEKRAEDMGYCHEVSLYLFKSSTTPVILLQEVLAAVGKLHSGGLTLRESRRFGNTLTIYQSFAANPKIRQDFLAAQLPNYLIPFVISKSTDDIVEFLRVQSLSVMGILCQTREGFVVKWALQTGMVGICIHAVEYGSEPSKVIAIHIIECLLLNEGGLHSICHPDTRDLQLILKVCNDLITLLARIQDFSPRIIFHVTRIYVVLCQNARAKALLRESLPPQLTDNTFQGLMQKYLPLSQLHQQLLTSMRGYDQYMSMQERTPPAPEKEAQQCSPNKSPSVKQYHLFGSPKADKRQLTQRAGVIGRPGPYKPCIPLQKDPRLHQQQASSTAYLGQNGSETNKDRRRQAQVPKDAMYSGKLLPAECQGGPNTGEDYEHSSTESSHVRHQLDFLDEWEEQLAPRGSSSSTGSCDYCSISGDRRHVAASHPQDYLSFKPSPRMLGAEAMSILGGYQDAIYRHMHSIGIPKLRHDGGNADGPAEGNTPIRPIDFDKQMWSSLARRREFPQLRADVVLRSGSSSQVL